MRLSKQPGPFADTAAWKAACPRRSQRFVHPHPGDLERRLELHMNEKAIAALPRFAKALRSGEQAAGYDKTLTSQVFGLGLGISACQATRHGA